MTPSDQPILEREFAPPSFRSLYALTICVDGEETHHTLPFGHETFSEVRWLGVSAADDAAGVFYLDKLKLAVGE